MQYRRTSAPAKQSQKQRALNLWCLRHLTFLYRIGNLEFKFLNMILHTLPMLIITFEKTHLPVAAKDTIISEQTTNKMMPDSVHLSDNKISLFLFKHLEALSNCQWLMVVNAHGNLPTVEYSLFFSFSGQNYRLVEALQKFINVNALLWNEFYKQIGLSMFHTLLLQQG